MTRTASVEQAARVKARQRRIAIDTERVERERREALVEDAATEFFAGAQAKVVGLAAAEAAENMMAIGVRQLLEAGLTLVQPAELCEITIAQMQRLRGRSAAVPDEEAAPAPLGSGR